MTIKYFSPGILTYERKIFTFFLIAIVFFQSCTQPAKKETITFSQDIASIIYEKCTGCHRPGQAVPFPLITYKDVAKRSKTFRETVDKQIMPPWPADPGYSHFRDENYLTEDEISLIDQWVEEGAPIGDSSKIPPPPNFPMGSAIGKPDVVLKIKPYLVKGDNTDRFMVMKIPFELQKDTFIRAVEFVPGCKYIHHVNGH